MNIQVSFTEEKETAVNMFRELINTPNVFEIDIHFHGEVGTPMLFTYEIKRAVVPETKTN